MNRIEIPLEGGRKLAVETNADPNFNKEIFIGLVETNGQWAQDIAIVRPKYNFDENGKTVYHDDVFEVLVYANENDEDYTDKFDIKRYEEEESCQKAKA